MKKYTVDVATTYVQTIEVTAYTREEAIATALDVFDVNNATYVGAHAQVVYREDLPATEGEAK